jgi:hypothetical protein
MSDTIDIIDRQVASIYVAVAKKIEQATVPIESDAILEYVKAYTKNNYSVYPVGTRVYDIFVKALHYAVARKFELIE